MKNSLKLRAHVLPSLLRAALFFLGSSAVAMACAECGGKKAGYWLAREQEPKASQLYPQARIVEYTLDIAETTLAPAGKNIRALSINGSVPGPTLRFREGEIARIHVRNRLPLGETSLHWHGLLVPNLEDGVPYLTTPPIPAGGSRTFEFLLKHAGTYWYHSHTGLQEQRGVYGSIVIEPKPDAPPRTDLPHIDREEVLVLSDWTHANADDILRWLSRGTDWYAIKKKTAQSLFGAARAGHLKEYLSREKSLVPPMDVSDIAYDAFLINGQPTSRLPARPGETIRLRVINAAASTYFYLSSATGPLTVISADGIDVRPIQQNRLLIGMAETYDLVVTLPPDASSAAYEIRATAQDNSGHASLLLGSGETRLAPTPGPLDPYDMESTIAAVLDQLDEEADVTDADALAAESPRPLPPYTRLRSLAPTTLPAEAPRRALTLKLTGDMNRYFWSIDGKPIDEQSTIAVKRGEVLRLTFVNNTMMHHPMHLHGHFFRLLMPGNDAPDFAPLKHTVDVPPMSRRVIEFYANEDRDWLFHCHLLYHMKAGMARVVSYPAGDLVGPDLGQAGATSKNQTTSNSSAPAYQPALGEHAMPHTLVWADANVESQRSSGLATLQRGRNNLHLGWETGWERVPRREYEIEATAARYFNSRWTAFVGYRLTNHEETNDGAILGVTHRLPYFVDLTATVHSRGEARLALQKPLQLTSRLRLTLAGEYDTAEDFSWSATASYTLSQRVSLLVSHDSEYGPGAGLAFRF